MHTTYPIAMHRNSMICLLFAITLIGVLAGCSRSQKETFSLTYTFTWSDFPSSATLTSEELDFDKPMNPSLFNIIDDSLILARNRNETKYYAELYRKKDYGLLHRFAPRGKGPGEYLSTYFSYKTLLSRVFILFDGTKKVASIYNIDSLYLKGMEFKPKEFPIPPFRGNDIGLIDTNTVVVYNKYYVSDKKFSNKTSPLLSYKMNEDIDVKEITKNYKYFTHNVTDAFIAVHPTLNLIWLIYQYENRIEIYDKQLKLLKVLIGPESFAPEYIVNEVMGSNIVLFKQSTWTYWQPFFTQDHLYVIYFGEYNGVRAQPVNVFKFNWKGELVHRYELDRNLYTIFVDANEEYIYGTDYVSGEYPKLVRYKIR